MTITVPLSFSYTHTLNGSLNKWLREETVKGIMQLEDWYVTENNGKNFNKESRLNAKSKGRVKKIKARWTMDD